MAKIENGISPRDSTVGTESRPGPDFTGITIRPGTAHEALDYARDPAEVPLPPELESPILGRKGWISLETREVFEKYLQILAQTGRYVAAAAGVGISRAQASQFRVKYPEFQDLCDEALERYKASLEAEAYRRAVHGVAKPVYHQGNMVGVTYERSDRLLELFLKAKIPEFREVSGGSRTTISVNATAQAASQAPGAAPPAMDPARMTKAQREAYRAFLATMGPDALPQAENGVHELAGASPRAQEPIDAESSEAIQVPPGGNFDGNSSDE